MKLKIKNNLNTVTPKVIEGLYNSFFSLTIKDKIKFEIFPIKIIPPK